MNASSKQNWRWLSLFLLMPVLSISMSILFLVYWMFSGGVKIDPAELESKDHVIYQGLENSGPVDYTEVINREFYKGVPNEQNFLVTVLETRTAGPGFDIDASLVAEYRKSLSFREPPPFPLLDVNALETILKDLLEELELPRNSCLLFHKRGCDPRFVDEKRLRLLDAVMKIQGPALDEVVEQLNQRNRFAVPIVSEVESLNNSIDNVQGRMLEIARWLSPRAGAALMRGELPKAWRDIRALLQLAERSSQGATCEDIELSNMTLRMVYPLYGALLLHPKLDVNLLNEIRRELPLVMPEVNFVRQVDIGERAYRHYFMDQVIIEGEWAEVSELRTSNPSDNDKFIAGFVKTNQVIDQFNLYVDEVVRLLGKSPDSLIAESKALQLKRVSDLRVSKMGIQSPLTDASIKSIRALLGMEGDGDRGWLDRVVQLYADNVALRRCMLLTAEIRAYASGNHALPKELDDLDGWVDPKWLIDPYTGQKWNYEYSDRAVVVHCAGIDGQDARGKFPDYITVDDIYYQVELNSVATSGGD